MIFYDVSIFTRFCEDDCTYLGLSSFSTVRYTSLSQCYDYINNLSYSPDAIVIRKLDINHIHRGSEYRKDMDILLNFD